MLGFTFFHLKQSVFINDISLENYSAAALLQDFSRGKDISSFQILLFSFL